MKVFNRIVLIGSLVVMSSCVTKGKDFSSNINWINKDQTSMQDIKQILGTPFSVGSSSGTPTWTYGYYKYRVIGKSQTKELKFYFAPDGAVRNFSFSSSFPADKRAAGFEVKSNKLGK